MKNIKSKSNTMKQIGGGTLMINNKEVFPPDNRAGLKNLGTL